MTPTAESKQSLLAAELWPIDSVTPYDTGDRRNPRTRPESAVKKLAASIREFGWQSPIVVDEAGVIIIGHGRLQAAQKLKLEEVPVRVAAGLSEAQVKALRLADNRTAEDATWLYSDLALEFGDLLEAGYDLKLTGFDADELAGMRNQQGSEDAPARHAVTCPECGAQFVPGGG